MSENTNVELRRAFLLLSEGAPAQDYEAALKNCGARSVTTRTVKGAGLVKSLAPDELSQEDLVVADLSTQNDPLSAVREILARLAPGAKVIALDKRNDVTYYRQLRFAGVSDYVLMPASGANLAASVGLAFGKRRSQEASLCAAFYSAHGGSGAGILAAGTAAYLAARGRSVLCADTDLNAPCVANHFGIDKGGDLGLILAAGERLDDVLVRQACAIVNDNLSLLSGLTPLRGSVPGERSSAKRLLDIALTEHQYTLWRVSGGSDLSREVMLRADMVFIVTSGSVSSAVSAKTCASWLREHNEGAAIFQVYNAVSPRESLTAGLVSQITGLETAFSIGYKKQLAAQLAVNLALNDASHALCAEFRALSAEIMGEKAPAKSGLLARLGL